MSIPPMSDETRCAQPSTLLDDIGMWLRLYPQVTDAVVEERIIEGKMQLVAHVSHTLSMPTIANLRRYLSVKLPKYPIPDSFVFLSTEPLNANVATTCNAPPAPQAESVTSDPSHRHATEDAVADIWRLVLQRNDFGRRDNFFDLGGDASLAFRMGTLLQERFAIDMHFLNVPRCGSVVMLARAIESELRLHDDPSALTRHALDRAHYCEAELQRMLKEEDQFGR